MTCNVQQVCLKCAEKTDHCVELKWKVPETLKKETKSMSWSKKIREKSRSLYVVYRGYRADTCRPPMINAQQTDFRALTVNSYNSSSPSAAASANRKLSVACGMRFWCSCSVVIDTFPSVSLVPRLFRLLINSLVLAAISCINKQGRTVIQIHCNSSSSSSSSSSSNSLLSCHQIVVKHKSTMQSE